MTAGEVYKFSHTLLEVRDSLFKGFTLEKSGFGSALFFGLAVLLGFGLGFGCEVGGSDAGRHFGSLVMYTLICAFFWYFEIVI